MKRLGVVAIAIGVVGVLALLLTAPWPRAERQVYGVSFSAPAAAGLGLDWREAYDATLNDLDVRRLRLAAYWDQIEPRDGQFTFADLDYQMDQAAKHNATVILAIGRKLPRWPECHVPMWARELSDDEQNDRVLAMLQVVIERYKHHPALRMWQLENEPLLNFGDCKPENRAFLAQEQQTVRLRDTDHPILITDSGELNSWIPAAAYGDVLGTTMYRTVFSGRTQKLFHYDYLFPSWLYRAKARLVKLIRGHDVLISELQGEPWGAKPFPEMTAAERRASLSPERLQQLQRFAARTQLPEAYWWGVEYWYWEKEVNNEPIFWESARDFFHIEVAL